MKPAMKPAMKQAMRHTMTRRPRHAGFTLVELMVTAAIMAVLASLALPLAEHTVRRGRESELRTALREIRGALDAYKQAVDEGRVPARAGESGYPPSLELLAEGVEDARSPNKAKIYFLRRLPRDPFHPEHALEAARTWGLRSYDSPPQAPREGRDVYDVHSLSGAVGLNGIAYSQW